ncbi:uncharacterized protein LOC130649291 [Hydractinia symbiolongicarpus]|uniref:uncharacterized protein LOC130649291 n=1 Tax=Hydractinia symbiolongicarpus TaxID=13093 RepID=UPI00254F6085|nr:uncharacterized protein LOC130649291 [Hydractinia symbiolongicarpus]
MESKKPQIIKEKRLTQLRVKQTACEMWSLLRLFPLMIGAGVDEDYEMCKLLIDFTDIVKRLCAPKFTEDHLKILEHLITNFLKNYCCLFPEIALKPTAHFITHYPANIWEFGPLIKTLRFESKHSYFKNSITNTRNYMNVCKSMAIHHQMLMYLYNKEDSYFSSHDIMPVGCKEKSINEIPELYKDFLSPIIPHAAHSLLEAQGVTYNGNKFYSSGVVVVFVDDKNLEMGEIISVYHQ